jgi:hypothetical protein
MHNYIWCPYFLPCFMKFCSVVPEELCWQAVLEVYFGKCLSSKGHISHKFRRSKFPGNMHNYIWRPYYLPCFMKFCSVVSEELCWQAALEVYFGKCLSSKGHISHKIQEIKISWYYAQLHMVSLLPTKSHEIMFSSFRGVALTSCFSSIFREIQCTQGHIVVDHLQRWTACHVWLGVYRCLLIAHLLCECLIVAKLGVVNLYLKVIKLWLTCTCSCIYLITHYNFNSIILDK